MSCCGQKRAEAARRVETETVTTEPGVSRDSRVFEYTGEGETALFGAVSGSVYRFAGRGARVEVAYADSFAMMAERDVRPAR